MEKLNVWDSNVAENVNYFNLEELIEYIRKEKIGFIKVVFAADSDVLLGAQMLCPRATDMIGEMATAIANGLTSRQLMYAMRAHPTFNEAISGAVENSRNQKVSW